MSTRDRGYQGYTGERTPPLRRWAVVFGHTLKMTAKQPWAIAIFIVAALPPLIGGGILYKVMSTLQEQLSQYQPGDVDPSKIPNTMTWILTLQTSWWCVVPLLGMLMATFAGGGAVAEDARQGAFQFYFARPLSRDQYLIGKLGPVVLMVFFVLFGPTLILTIVREVMFMRGFDSVGQMILLPLRALALSLVHSLVLAVPAVAISSLSKRRGMVQGAFAGAYMLPWALGWMMQKVTRSAWPSLLSIPDQVDAVGARLFGYTPPPDERILPWFAAAIVMLVLVGGSVAVLRWRLTSVEVVAG